AGGMMGATRGGMMRWRLAGQCLRREEEVRQDLLRQFLQVRATIAFCRLSSCKTPGYEKNDEPGPSQRCGRKRAITFRLPEGHRYRISKVYSVYTRVYPE